MFIYFFISFYDIIDNLIHIKGYKKEKDERDTYKMGLATWILSKLSI